MLRIFEILHPGCIAHVAYDNSANHHAMAAYALLSNRLNLKDGGKKTACTRLGGLLDRTAPRSCNVCKLLKASRKDVVQFCRRGTCLPTECNWKNVGKFFHISLISKSRNRCLRNQFAPWGTKSFFMPNMHAKFKFIEMFWGSCKAYARKRCDYSWAGLKSVVREAFESVSLPTIRHFARKSDRYIDAYREKDGGLRLTPAQVEHAVNKYKSIALFYYQKWKIYKIFRCATSKFGTEIETCSRFKVVAAVESRLTDWL